jgi:hypothetical protein
MRMPGGTSEHSFLASARGSRTWALRGGGSAQRE